MIETWKPCIDVHWLETLWSATENNHLLCYWPKIHNLIPKICLSLHFSEVNNMLNENWAKNVLWENISTLIYVKCNSMCWLIFCVDQSCCHKFAINIFMILLNWMWPRPLLECQMTLFIREKNKINNRIVISWIKILDKNSTIDFLMSPMSIK